MNFIEDIVDQHAEDASLLWSRRQRFLRTNILDPSERQRLDGRLEGHLDGLFIAREAGWRSGVRQAETACGRGELFVLAWLAFLKPTEQQLEQVFGYVPEVENGVQALISAVGWHAAEHVLPALGQWLRSKDPTLRHLAVAGHAIHRRDTGLLAETLRDEAPLVRARSARMIGELGAASHVGAVQTLLDDPEPGPRFEAVLTLARFGDRSPRVMERLLTTAEAGGVAGRRAAQALALLDPVGTSKRVRQWGAQPKARRLAAVAAAATGDSALLSDLISWMEDDTVARVAGDAFSTLTGVDLAYLDLDGPVPPSAEEVLNDDPEDPRVELDEEDGLAWPSATSVERWWSENRDRFPAGARYLGGQAVAPLRGQPEPRHLEVLRTLARTGRAGHAALAAALLAQGAPHRPVIETRAPATRGHALPGWEA